jgi:SOS response regulatory protein OraA/RecX
MTNFITDIQSSDDDPNNRVIFVNELRETTIPASTVEYLSLHIQQPWTDELANQVHTFEDIEKARSMALKLISMKAWGVQELANRLVKRGIDKDIAQTITMQLEEDDWLCDTTYACARIREWMRVEPASRAWLRMKLKDRSLTTDTCEQAIEEELGDLCEQDAATELATIRLAKTGSLDEATTRRRVIAAICRRGFPTDVASEAYRRAQTEIA